MVRLINDHGIIALAAYNIKEAGLEDEIPKTAMAMLENGYMMSVARNTWLTEQWKDVNSLLCSSGIKHILLKGMALEHTLYGSKGLRQMSDNDILINPPDSVRAWELLQKNGFSAEPLKSFLFKKIIFDYGNHLPSLNRNGYLIEIHDTLFERKDMVGPKSKDPFADAEEIRIGNIKALSLSEDMQLAYLIKHFEHHKTCGDCQIRLYNDIRLLDKFNPVELPEGFIAEPLQSNKKEFRKSAYKTRIRSIHPKHRLTFLLGDTFPSLRWMKERYKCDTVKALFFYPLRIGKLMWLI